ncbi:MAG: hypothetical protein HYS25_10885 [Ignavibacteriales bacterium]|nr:hypothetical protein [Ignavibacteriales bacterium]
MEIENIGYAESDYLLTKLKFYLNFELSASALYILSYSYGSVLVLSAGAALIFTPFIIYSLYKTQKFFWLSSFFVLIIIPSPIVYLVSEDKTFFSVLLFVELGVFYFYCVILRFVVNDWAEEIRWREIRKLQKAEFEMSKKMFMEQFDEPST